MTGNKATVTLVRTAARVQGVTDFHNCRVTLLCFLLLSHKKATQMKAAERAIWGFDRLKNSGLHFRLVPWPLLLIAGAKIHQINKSQIQQRS